MKTSTHVYLRMTLSDRLTSMPIRHMEREAWIAYRNSMLRRHGFDLTRNFTATGTTCDTIYSQEIEDGP